MNICSFSPRFYLKIIFFGFMNHKELCIVKLFSENKK